MHNVCAVVPLPQRFAAAEMVLRDRCMARLREGAVSSLVERGRDSLPASPDGVLPSRLYRGSPGVAKLASEKAVSRQGGLGLNDNGRGPCSRGR